MDKPLIIWDPLPRTMATICDAETRRKLDALGTLVVSEDRPMPDETLDEFLPQAALLFGQTALPRERLARATRLKAVFNVEGNFLPNVDYDECQVRGIPVLTPGAAFAKPVAECALAMAIDLARGITAGDRAFRAGKEVYGLASNADSFPFTGAPVGIIGFGDLGRALRALLVPFKNPVAVFDPWLPPDLIAEHDGRPTDLDDLLRSSRVIFVFAGATSENHGFIGEREFGLIAPGSAFLLMSRAAVVDFAAFTRHVASGRIRAATDVFPEEPVAAADPIRALDGLLLSAHRTGGTVDALHRIGRMAVADAELILRGHAPQLCRRADASTAARLRSKPVAAT